MFKFVRYDLKYSKPYKLVVNGLYKSSKKVSTKLLNFHINGGKIIKKYNIKFININLINIFFLKLKNQQKRQKDRHSKRMKILLEYLNKIVEHNNNIIVSKFLFTFLLYNSLIIIKKTKT